MFFLFNFFFSILTFNIRLFWKLDFIMFFQFILCKVIMISWIKFVFSISILNIEYVRNGALHFFLFFFMNLSWSHDLDGGFNILIWIDLSCFFIIFLIDFFSISSFNVGLVRNWLCNFFFYGIISIL
jgi:hypothetical protein